jgi:tetratricopeptide (TPR) repeat protein
MDWAREEEQAALGLRLLHAHYTVWVVRGHCGEGQRRAEELLGLEGPVDPRLRSRALVVAGSMTRLGGDLARAMILLEQALAIARETGDGICIAFACQQLGVAVGLTGDSARALRLLEESLALMRAVNGVRGIAMTTHLLAWQAQQQGQLDRARELWEESLSLVRKLREPSRIALVLSNLAGMAVQQGDLERAKGLLLECLPVAQQDGYQLILMTLLERMAAVAVGEGEAARAALFLGAAEVARGMAGEALEPAEQAIQQRTVATGRAQIGDDEWERVYQEGRALPFEEALALARAYATEQHHRSSGQVVQDASPDPGAGRRMGTAG